MAIEQVQRSYCVVNKGKGEPVSGGYTEETWEGTWAEMCAYADRQSAAGGAKGVVADLGEKRGLLSIRAQRGKKVAGCAARPWTGRKRKNLKCREAPVKARSIPFP
jgi:hypothetical protein